MSNRVKGLLAVGSLVALVAAFYWKLSFTDEFVWFDHPDMVYLELPRLEFQAREFHRGRFPLWDPHIWMGQPLVGQTQPGPVNPLNLLMMLWPLDEAGYLRTRVLNLYFVAMHVVAALGLYWLCRELKRSRAASILAACAFSLGGFVGSVAWLDVLSGALWTPWVALFFLRAVRGRRPAESAALGGLFLGLAWMSGHHEIPLLTTVALACCWLAVWGKLQLARSFSSARPYIGWAALMFTIAGLVAAVQIWPTLEFGRLAMRWGPAGPGPFGWNDKIPYLSSSIYSFTPRGILGIIFPDRGTNADASAFLGVIVSALTLLGLVTGWRHAAVRWLSVLAGGSLIYGMGEFTPAHGVLNTLLPMIGKARVPVRALHLFNFAAAVLAAYGADRILSGRSTPWNRRIAAALAAGGGCILLGALGWNAAASEALILSAFVSLAWLALVYRPVANRVAWLGLALLLMMAELNTALTRRWGSRHDEKAQPYAKMLHAHRDIVEFLRREPTLNRVRVNDRDIPVNFGDLHSIDMLEGYLAGVTANILHIGRHTPAGQRLFGVTHYVGRQAELPEWEEIFAGAGSVKVFRNPRALARARTVHQVETVTTAALLSGRIEDPSFDAGKTAIVVGTAAPSLEACDVEDTVAVAAYAPNRVRIHARMACRGLLVLSDTYFPGWQASVDGRPVSILEVYGGMRGVVVDGGRHELDFRYRPISVYGGAALSALGLLVTIVLVVGRLGRRETQH